MRVFINIGVISNHFALVCHLSHAGTPHKKILIKSCTLEYGHAHSRNGFSCVYVEVIRKPSEDSGTRLSEQPRDNTC